MSSQDYEFLTQQMGIAIKLDEKKRSVEYGNEVMRDEIGQLRSNFMTKFSQDIPPKPPEFHSRRGDVDSEHAKLRRLENKREMLDKSVSNKTRLILIALYSVAAIITASLIYWATQDATPEWQKGWVAFLWFVFIGIPFGQNLIGEGDFYDVLREMVLGWADYDSIDAEILDIQHKINTEGLCEIYSKWQERKSREDAQLDFDIDVINNYITSAEKEIVVIVQAIKNAFRSVSHFTPYNDRVVFGEQKILDGPGLSDSVDAPFVDDLL